MNSSCIITRLPDASWNRQLRKLEFEYMLFSMIAYPLGGQDSGKIRLIH